MKDAPPLQPGEVRRVAYKAFHECVVEETQENSMYCIGRLRTYSEVLVDMWYCPCCHKVELYANEFRKSLEKWDEDGQEEDPAATVSEG